MAFLQSNIHEMSQDELKICYPFPSSYTSLISVCRMSSTGLDTIIPNKRLQCRIGTDIPIIPKKAKLDERSTKSEVLHVVKTCWGRVGVWT